MRWRAFYTDGSSIASSESTWRELPAEGLVLLKVWPDEGPKAIYCGTDATWWDEAGRVYQLDLPPAIEEWAKMQIEAGFLKVGELMPDDAYAELYARALETTE